MLNLRWIGAAAAAVALMASPATAKDETTFQAAPTEDIDEGPGDSVKAELSGGLMWRTEDEIWFELHAGDLEAEHAYTVWWVIFNNPEKCDGGAVALCSGNDLFRVGPDGALFYATGFVSDKDGVANTSAHLRAGDIPDGVPAPIPGEPAGGSDGLTPGNGFDAEVHVIVRRHVQTKNGDVHEQISTLNAGCDGKCTDERFFVFEANPPSN